MKLQTIYKYTGLLAALFFINGPWLFAYNGAHHGFIIFSHDGYTLVERMLFSTFGAIFQTRIYVSIKNSKTMLSFCFNSEFTTACIAILIVMDWHHKLLIIPIYLTWCIFCGIATFLIYRFVTGEMAIMDLT